MKKIEFENGTTIDGASTFNQIQQNVEEVFNGDTSMGSIRVENIECKQLFDKNNAKYLANSYIGGDGTIGQTNQVRTYYIECKPNTTYTISKIAGKYFRFGSNAVVPTLNATITQVSANDTGTSITLTTEENDKYLLFNCHNSGADTLTEQEILNSIQIEKGDKATPYTPFKEFDNRPKLLWKNPHPSATFETQDITLSSSDYDMLIWIFDTYVFSGLSESEMSLKGFGVRTSISNSTGTAFITRTITRNSDTSFTVGSGYNNGTVDENSLIPRAIYGFKTS